MFGVLRKLLAAERKRFEQFGSEDAKGERTASKSVEPGSFPGTPAIHPKGWVASHWNDYMRVSGWREQPCTKHATPHCEECYWFSGVCVE